MGYIFDAMKREEPKRPDHQSPAKGSTPPTDALPADHEAVQRPVAPADTPHAVHSQAYEQKPPRVTGDVPTTEHTVEGRHRTAPSTTAHDNTTDIKTAIDGTDNSGAEGKNRLDTVAETSAAAPVTTDTGASVDPGDKVPSPATAAEPNLTPAPTPTPLRLSELLDDRLQNSANPAGGVADRAATPPSRSEALNGVASVQTDFNDIDDRLVALTERVSVIAEEYRGIRTSLLARWDQRRHLVHLITSATPQEGKTITSLNLGLSLGELHNRRTIVVECDLRLPQFGKLLSLPESPGLVGYLEGRAELDQIVHAIGDSQLHVIPAGSRANDRAVQLLSSNKMAALLDDLRRRYDHVIIDTPPVVDLADAGILGALSDDVLLIVRMHTTPRGLVEQAARTLASYNAPVTNMIATNQTHVGSSYYRSYYSRYGSRYTYRYRYNRYHEQAKAA